MRANPNIVDIARIAAQLADRALTPSIGSIIMYAIVGIKKRQKSHMKYPAHRAKGFTPIKCIMYLILNSLS